MSFDIVKHRVWWFTLSSVLVIASLISIFINGFNFGIDYTGGTILDMQFHKAVTVSEVRQVIDNSDMDLGNTVIQLTGVTDQDSSTDVMLRMRNLTSDESKAVSDKLSDSLGGAEIKRTESVGAVIGSEVTKNAITSLAVAFIAGVAMIVIGPHSKWAFFLLFCIFSMMQGSTRPYSTNILLALRSTDVGAASSLINFVHSFCGVIGMSLVVVPVFPNYIVAIGFFMAGMVGLGLILWVVLCRKGILPDGV